MNGGTSLADVSYFHKAFSDTKVVVFIGQALMQYNLVGGPNFDRKCSLVDH